MKILKYLPVVVFCFVALLLLAKSEPRPDDGEDDATYRSSSDEYYEYDAKNLCERSEPCLNGGTCEDGFSSYTCNCPDDFAGNDCEVVNTCRYTALCDLTNDLEKCLKCRDGFIKDPEDDTRCLHVNQTAYLILVLRGSIIQLITLDGKKIRETASLQLENDNNDNKNIGSSSQTRTMFFLSGESANIHTSTVNPESGEINVLLDEEEPAQVMALYIDMIYHHIYFIEGDTLVVSNFNGTIRKTIFKNFYYGDIIYLNPVNACFYWKRSKDDFVEVAGLDGSNRHKLIGPTKEDDVFQFAIGYLEKKLYWQLYGGYWSTEYDGFNSKQIPASEFYSHFNRQSSQTFDMYFYSSNSSEVYKTHRCNNVDSTMIYKAGDNIQQMAVFHATLESEAKNLCKKRTEECEQLCFPVQVFEGNRSTFSTKCACSDGLTLAADEKSCV